MRKLLILSVLLMAFVVHAVPTDNGAGFGLNASIAVDGSGVVLASIIPTSIEANRERGFSASSFYFQGVQLQRRSAVLFMVGVVPSVTSARFTASPLDEKRSHVKAPTIVLRC